MNAKPSSSTSKNFIQMNIEKIAAKNSKNRTKSQELPLKSQPANSGLLSSSKNSGGTLKHISNYLQGKGPKDPDPAKPQISTSEKITEVIENTKSMIEECVKALTPIKPSVAQMSVIDEGLDSKSSQDAQEEIMLNQVTENTLETTDGQNLNSYFEAAKKTPESRYKESDVHQIVYSVSGSDYVSPNEKYESLKAENTEVINKLQNENEGNLEPLESYDENSDEIYNDDECWEIYEDLRHLSEEIHLKRVGGNATPDANKIVEDSRKSIGQSNLKPVMGNEKSDENYLVDVIDDKASANNELLHSEKSEKMQKSQKSYKKSESESQKSRKYNTRKHSSHKGELGNIEFPQDTPKEFEHISSESEEIINLEVKHPELMLRRSARLAHKKEIKKTTKEKEPVRRKKSKKNAGHKKKIKY